MRASGLNRAVGRAFRRLHARWVTPNSLRLRAKLFGFWNALDAIGRLPMWEIPDALRLFGASIGDRACIRPGLRIDNAEGDLSNLVIGENVYIGSDVFIDLSGPVRIADDVAISARTCIVTHISVGDRPLSRIYPTEVKGVVIGRGALVGTASVILHGVTIGRESVIAAQSVVRYTVPAQVMVAGIPARQQRALPAAV